MLGSGIRLKASERHPLPTGAEHGMKGAEGNHIVKA